jgi:uncharacterized membrane protein YjjB (DUF3815 family)
MSFLSAANEPLRRYIYGVALAVLALLVVTGVITPDLSDSLATIASAALVVGAVEKARSKVTPVSDEDDYIAEHRAPE